MNPPPVRRDGFARLPRPRTTTPTDRYALAVFAPRRGIGASTVARAVAEIFARRARERPAPRAPAPAGALRSAPPVRDERVALALLDPRPRRAASPAFSPSPAPAHDPFAPRLSETTRLLDGSALAAPVGDGLWVVRWSRAARAALLDARAVGALIEQVTDRAQRTVFDCEHLINERTLTALDAAHHVLLLTRLTVPAIRATQRVLRICLRLGYPDDKLRIVVNAVDGHDVISVADAAGVLRRDIYWQLPRDPATSGSGLIPPGSDLANACIMLADALAHDSVQATPPAAPA